MTNAQRLILCLASIGWIAPFIGEAYGFTCVPTGDCPYWKLVLRAAPHTDQTWPESVHFLTTANRVGMLDDGDFLIVAEIP
jgi:hypothetical protein